MNILSQQFGNLIQKYPNEEHTIERIFNLFSEEKREYPLFGLYELTTPSSTYALTHILNTLVSIGFLQKHYRVISKADNGGIKDYPYLTEIPEDIYDWRSEQDIHVTPDIIKVIYKTAAG
ncbi:hypothetical protein [Agaribacterium sp. ZY112]|uniref:hypothetical protein n=1 Tax=Agaribacterium sp. ZY112 TaxID=3233574 RepID=UPI0035246250